MAKTLTVLAFGPGKTSGHWERALPGLCGPSQKKSEHRARLRLGRKAA